MKLFLTLSLALATIAAPVAAQVDPLVLKHHKDVEDRAKDEKIKAQEKIVARDTANKQNRLDLANLLEAAAADCEKSGDTAGVWRYYQRAAAVLRDPREEAWEARAAADTSKAATFRAVETEQRYRIEEARAIAKRALAVPLETPSLNLQVQQEQDKFAENLYREDVWKRTQSAWLASELRKEVTDTSRFKKPVIISFDVHTEGNITDITIISSSGDERIDLAALKVVRDLGKLQPLLPGMGSLVRFQTEFGK
ncbi:MAG: TonB family protein [Cyanobacteria bacterium SZAS TMP-1]|nr:TonB family protein [Cyanobacteria bacterium SZAS TMP-1]